MIKLVVFDFDGTLVDSKNIIYEIIRDHLDRNGFSIGAKFKREMGLHRLRSDLKTLGIEKDIEKIIGKINLEIVNNVAKFRVQRGFKNLFKIDKKKIILSNNAKHSIIAFLNKKRYKKLFDRVYGAEDFKNKTDGLGKIMKRQKLKPSEVLFIGDRASDIEVGVKVGCYSGIIYNGASWGTKREALASGADFIIDDLGKIKKILKKLDSL